VDPLSANKQSWDSEGIGKRPKLDHAELGSEGVRSWQRPVECVDLRRWTRGRLDLISLALDALGWLTVRSRLHHYVCVLAATAALSYRKVCAAKPRSFAQPQSYGLYHETQMLLRIHGVTGCKPRPSTTRWAFL